MKRNIDKQLKQWQKKEKRKPLVLLGARQIGKTHSLKQFGNDNFKNHFYINFERQKEYQQIFEKDLKPQRIISELEILFNQKIDIKTDLIIFDEIQDCPKAITSLKYFCEEVPKLAICAAGSLLGVNLSQSSFPVGKINSINMYPLSFFEFIEAIGEHFLFKYLILFFKLCRSLFSNNFSSSISIKVATILPVSEEI
jgi:predicted AAA+ superfamily ATPase